MRRFFSKRQKDALYQSGGGVCADCGIPLGFGWHADHVAPWVKGGATAAVNGQPLCAKCNLRKGITMRPEQKRSFANIEKELWPWQQDALGATKKQGRFDPPATCEVKRSRNASAYE